MAPIATIDVASLERFTTDLIQAGFEPVDPDKRRWSGPVPECVQSLAPDATAMEIVVQDGWPFLFPKVFAQGARAAHVSARGEICLWRAGDNTKEWLTLGDLYARLQEWCDQIQRGEGFSANDNVLDAHLYFQAHDQALAVFDPTQFTAQTNGQFDRLRGREKHSRLLEIEPGSAQNTELRGYWYFRSGVSLSPRNLDEFRDALNDPQRKNFDRGIERLRRGNSNALQLALLVWSTPFGRNYLALRLRKEDNEVTAKSLEVAPNDEGTLSLRAGPAASLLRSKRLAIFGAGGLGSHTSLLLAESGIGQMKILDSEVLRPGNVVRHTAGPAGVGFHKANLVADVCQKHAPWTEAEPILESLWNPEELEETAQSVDMVVDTTGLAALTEQLSLICETVKIPMVSVALFRGGSIARVRRQIEGDSSIYLRRTDATEHPLIPPGSDEEELAGVEAGCSSPVANAPPSSVVAAGALAAQVVIDALLAEARFGEEVIDVYKPIDDPPFNEIGRVPDTWST